MSRVASVQKKISSGMNNGICVTVWVLVMFLIFSGPGAAAGPNGKEIFSETGIAMNTGYTYDPSDGGRLLSLSVFKLYDYERIWHHPAPDNLKFKIEGSVGGALTDEEKVRSVAGAGVLALLYIDSLKNRYIRPYVEGGVGVIYTDYQVNGQDYRFNFNPQAGVGIEINSQKGLKHFVSLRAHHISNGGIGPDNRGQNTVVFSLGRYF